VDAYVFEAELDEDPAVSRRVAVRGDQTLVDLHEELRRAFEWWDDHLYSFWLDGEFWGSRESEYTSPIEPEDGGATRFTCLCRSSISVRRPYKSRTRDADQSGFVVTSSQLSSCPSGQFGWGHISSIT
jgi:hypothetical protein